MLKWERGFLNETESNTAVQRFPMNHYRVSEERIKRRSINAADTWYLNVITPQAQQESSLALYRFLQERRSELTFGEC